MRPEDRRVFHPPQDHERFRDWDAAYVLGALTPADRHEFESHLRTCADCTSAVGELAAMPGLLTRIRPEPDPAEVIPPVRSGPAPSIAAASTADRRSRSLLWALVAVVILVLLIPAAVGSRSVPEDLLAVPLDPVSGIQTGMSVEVELETVAWGTSVSIQCTYPAVPAGVESTLPATRYDAASSHSVTTTSYGLVVTDGSGASHQISSWQAVPGRTITVDASTAIALRDIDEISVVTSGGTVLLTSAIDR